LAIQTQLRKSIEDYVSIGPHVAIAKRMQDKGLPVGIGSMIEYVIIEGKGKNERIRDKARLPDEVKEGGYDAEYYIDHQIVPAVETIFNVFNIPKDEIIESKKQKKLGDF
jgi:DNA polymerase I